jgi:hypothetical protein
MTVTSTRDRPLLPRWAKWLIALVMVMVFVLLAVDVLTRASRRRWQAYAASIRASGQPLTFDEIEAARPKVPDEKNGALVIERLADELEQLPSYSDNQGVNEWVFYFGDRNEGRDFLTGIAWERIEPSRAFLAEHQDLLDALGDLRDKPSGRLDIPNTDDIIESVFPRLSPIRAAGKLIAVRLSLNIFDNSANAAIDDLRLFSHVTGTLNDHPSVIADLVQIALDALLIYQLEAYLVVFIPSAEQLGMLNELTSVRLAASDLMWPLIGERAYVVGLFNDFTNLKAYLGGAIQPSFADRLPFVPELLARTNQIRAVKLITDLIDAGDSGTTQLAASRKMANELASLSIVYRLAQETTDISRYVELHFRCYGQLKSALTAIAAERFRMDHGRFPQSLDELVPEYLDEVPIDPFDNKPIKMKETDLGIVIYTIGDNEVDNDGQVEFDENRRPLDFGIRLLRPEHRGLKLIRVTEETAPEAQSPNESPETGSGRH